jgi:hypothetical protein
MKPIQEQSPSQTLAQSLQGISALPRETRRDIGLGDYSALTHSENIVALHHGPKKEWKLLRAVKSLFAARSGHTQVQCCPSSDPSA